MADVKKRSRTDSVKSQNDEPTTKAKKTAVRVKCAPDGSLIIDEESLVVNQKSNINEGPVIIEKNGTSGITKYSSFRKSKDGGKKKRWSKEETAKFYNGLQLFGTDFTLMANVMFPGARSREDLHNKFKREEKLHLNLIDDVLKKSYTAEIPTTEIEQLTKMLEEGSGSENEDEDAPLPDDKEPDASSEKVDQSSKENPEQEKKSDTEDKPAENQDANIAKST